MSRNRILLLLGMVALGGMLYWRLAGDEKTAAESADTSPPRRERGKHSSIRLRGLGEELELRADARITGQLHGIPVGEQASVRLFRLLGNEDQPAQSGSVHTAGKYDFGALLPGSYCIAAEAAGLHGSACNVRVGPGEVKEQDVWLGQADRLLTGKVHDAGGGTVPAPAIVAQKYPSFDAVWSSVGGIDGAYRLGLPAGVYRVTAVADGYTSSTAYVELSGGIKQATHDFHLNPASTISGTVVFADSKKTAPGAKVIARAPGQPPQSSTADGAGKFTITNLRPNLYEVSADLDDLVSEPARISISLGEDEQVELLLVRGTGVIEGRVVDGASNAPVANAEVRLRDTRRDPIKTDEAGAFRIGGLLAGLYNVSVAASGYGLASQQVMVGNGQTKTIEVRVPKGGTIRGVVKSSGGKPVSGARIQATVGGERDPRLAGIRTDESGRFRLDSVPPGRASLTAYHEDYGLTPKAGLELASGETRDISLIFDSTGAIAGSVKYDDGGAAPGAIVFVDSSDASWRTAAGEGGNFRIEGLPRGAYYLRARPPGALQPQLTHAPSASKRISLTAGETALAELIVPGGNDTIRGTVVDGDGAPIMGAAVWAERVTPNMMSGTNLAHVTNFTWSDGRFELAKVPRGEFRVYAKHVEYAEAFAGPVPPGSSDVVVRLAPLAGIEGRVISRDGSPAQTFQLRWRYLTRSAGGSRAYRSGRQVFRAADSLFRVKGLPPSEEYTLSAESAGGEYGELEKPFSLGTGEQRKGLVLRLKGVGRVKGRILDKATGKPALGVQVSLSHRGLTHVDGQGRFDVEVVEGAYERLKLQVATETSAWGLPPVDRAFTVKAGRVTDLGDIETSLGPK